MKLVLFLSGTCD